MSNLKLSNITVKYESDKKEIIDALTDINTTFNSGLMNVIIGESGSGKTTLIKSIAKLILYNGLITYNDVDIQKIEVRNLNIAYVSQDIVLYPHLTVYQNIAFPLKALGIDDLEIDRRVKEIASLLDISLLLTRKPKVLSIGQRQRVTIARALIRRCNIYLFDEPFSNLDEKLAIELCQKIKKILKTYNSINIFVTHSIKETMYLADNLLVINDSKLIYDGKLVPAINHIDNRISGFFKATIRY